MNTTLEEVHKLLQSLPEKDLARVRDFVKVLQEEPGDLTEEERKEVQKGQSEFRRGDWVRWEDVRRQDV